MSKVIGYFHFKIDQFNLFGQYMNGKAPGKLLPESAIKYKGSPGDFDGDYKTVWRDDTDTHTADLKIIDKKDGSFILEWRNILNYPSGEIYNGTGIIRNDELTGYYEMP